MCAANGASRGGVGPMCPTLPNKTFPFLPICSISRKEVHRTAGRVWNCCSFPQHIVSQFLQLSNRISYYNGENQQQRFEYSAGLVPGR